jgi:sigma-E factor negative regulatory protein RseA
MSEQIREQVSAFLDGELHDSEMELLLKRLARDGELRERFGRYALIGEACRGTRTGHLTRSFAERVNGAIDGEPLVAAAGLGASARNWWRPVAGGVVAAGVAVVAVFALQQRADTPTVAARTAPAAMTAPAAVLAGVPKPAVPMNASNSKEPVSYTVPAALGEANSALPAARLTNYVFAHSRYPSLLGQRDVLTDLIVASDDQAAGTPDSAPAQPSDFRPVSGVAAETRVGP